ncbi:hypothetical protein PAHAL_9G149400 [Panicum hallii]|uniref:Uncharacterized protein n=1 Tax=Panicum hallii TaxID=206008 RepID=A0A2T8I197_9POAL|nr:hypothetical protein PAHAL_9G149400 [Panicum hallii]
MGSGLPVSPPRRAPSPLSQFKPPALFLPRASSCGLPSILGGRRAGLGPSRARHGGRQVHQAPPPPPRRCVVPGDLPGRGGGEGPGRPAPPPAGAGAGPGAAGRRAAAAAAAAAVRGIPAAPPGAAPAQALRQRPQHPGAPQLQRGGGRHRGGVRRRVLLLPLRHGGGRGARHGARARGAVPQGRPRAQGPAALGLRGAGDGDLRAPRGRRRHCRGGRQRRRGGGAAREARAGGDGGAGEGGVGEVLRHRLLEEPVEPRRGQLIGAAGPRATQLRRRVGARSCSRVLGRVSSVFRGKKRRPRKK